MSKQNNILSNKAPCGDVVELSNDWQQVGGALGNVLGRLKVTPAKATGARAEATQRARSQPAGHVPEGHVIGADEAPIDKAA